MRPQPPRSASWSVALSEREPVQPRVTGILNRRHTNRDAGFSLVELVVAMFIIGGVLLSLVTLQTKAMVSIAQAKERQQATAVANQILEELRALPWLVVSNGSLSDGIPSDDPYVASGKLSIPGEPVNGEELVLNEAPSGPTYDLLQNSPLHGDAGKNVTFHSDPATALVFIARAYVTESGSGNELNLTVVVEWESRGGSERQVVARSSIFNTRSGCGSGSNKPYATACQDFYVADASASGHTISINGSKPSTAAEDDSGPFPILSDANIQEVVASAPTVGIVIDSAQSSSVTAQASHGTLTVLDLAGNRTSVSNGDSVGVNVSDAITSGQSRNEPLALPRFKFEPVEISGVNGSLKLTTARRSGEGAANTTSNCSSWATAGQPCGYVSAGLGILGEDTLEYQFSGETIPLLSVRQEAVEINAARYPGSTVLPDGSQLCEVLSGSGCIQARISQTQFVVDIPGAVELRGTLAGGSSSGDAEPDRRFSMAQSGSVKTLWDGSTHSLGSALDQTSDEEFTVYDANGIKIFAEARVTASPATADGSANDPACEIEACTSHASASPISISVTYTIDAGDATSSFSVAVTAGGGQSSATYKASPGAWTDD